MKSRIWLSVLALIFPFSLPAEPRLFSAQPVVIDKPGDLDQEQLDRFNLFLNLGSGLLWKYESLHLDDQIRRHFCRREERSDH